MRLYSIKDTKAATFGQPFPMVNDQVAIRSVKLLANDNSTDIGNYSEDYDLWFVGELDINTGILTSQVNFLINCQDLKEVIHETNI